MFIHHVYFWMPAESTPAEKEQLATGIRSLMSIEQIKMSHLGMPANTNRPVIERSYTYSWLAVFDTPEDEAKYQVHPTHLKFIETCKHLWTKVIVYDSI